jgi:hypothetical protein
VLPRGGYLEGTAGVFLHHATCQDMVSINPDEDRFTSTPMKRVAVFTSLRSLFMTIRADRDLGLTCFIYILEGVSILQVRPALKAYFWQCLCFTCPFELANQTLPHTYIIALHRLDITCTVSQFKTNIQAPQTRRKI